MKKKVISLLLCSAMMASLLAGCGAKEVESSKESSKEESKVEESKEEVKEEVPAEPVHVSVAGYFFGPVNDEKDVITPAVEARLLEEHGINVDIELVYIEQANYAELINTRLAGGTAPDVFLAQSEQTVETYYDQGVIASWDME